MGMKLGVSNQVQSTVVRDGVLNRGSGFKALRVLLLGLAEIAVKVWGVDCLGSFLPEPPMPVARAWDAFF